ncbi:MAG: hypothetical protein MPJ50_13485 [Pirellulales bacterium]|nr:hypothetical protein [Pirellulales bacterium]
MLILLGALSGLLGIAVLVFTIILIVKMFQHGQTGLGVVTIVLTLCTGIGPIIALVVGWQNAASWKIKNLMMPFTLCFAGWVVATGAFYAMFGFAFLEMGQDLQEFQDLQNQQFQNQLQDMQDFQNQQIQDMQDLQNKQFQDIQNLQGGF